MTAQPEAFLPLRPVELQILVALHRRDLHGYGILQESEGGAVPGLVTLYRALERMEDRGLLTRVGGDARSEDDRRRTYRITGLGRRVLRAEAVRLRRLVHVALEGDDPLERGDA